MFSIPNTASFDGFMVKEGVPVPPMAPSPLAFAAPLGGHVLVQKTAFLCQGEPATEYVAQREIPQHCWISVGFLVPS